MKESEDAFACNLLLLYVNMFRYLTFTSFHPTQIYWFIQTIFILTITLTVLTPTLILPQICRCFCKRQTQQIGVFGGKSNPRFCLVIQAHLLFTFFSATLGVRRHPYVPEIEKSAVAIKKKKIKKRQQQTLAFKWNKSSKDLSKLRGAPTSHLPFS